MASKTPEGPMQKSNPIVSNTCPSEKIWTPVVADDIQFILQTLLKKFEELGIKKMKGQSKKGNKAKRSDEINEKVDNLKTKKEAQKTGWTVADLKKHLAIGTHEVRKALNKNDLDMVIVCKSAEPEIITRHIIELSYSREVPACRLPRLSENVAPALGIRHVLALGFRKSSDVFREQVLAITARIPPLHAPCLPTECGQTEDVYVTVEDDGSEEEESVIPTPSRKETFSPYQRPPDVKLQELKVKKIVPNPRKKQKFKVKKSLMKKYKTLFLDP
ncbi:ribonuclease P protein subunit p38 isoform X3 [Ranitomeya variabilis]|uniref:ribonuclease P protein subunit p38 isoform X3 n=1 Tax=Ranitomeya variabilis TaxID=490064 RepID=UPI0040573815